MSLLDKLLNVGSVSGASVMSQSKFFNEKEMVQTDLPILNVAYSGDLDGGFTPGITITSGDSKTFKSMLGLYCLRSYLKKYPEAIGIIYDSEYGISLENLKAFGIDPSRIIHIPVEHIEQLKFDFVKKLDTIKQGDKVFFMIDSLGQLASKKETDDAIDEKSVADMTRAKAIRSLFRLVTIQLVKKELPCYVINHVYSEVGCLDGSTIVITDKGSKKISEIEIGDKVLTDKNRFKEVTYAYSPDQISSKDKKFFEVEFDDGSVIRATGNHQFLMADLSWKRLDEISEKDEFHVSMFNQGGLNVQADDKNAQ